MPVKVRAPSGHRLEGRVKSGAVYPTSREPVVPGSLGQGADSVFDEEPSTSRGASARFECLDEELLDYDEDVEEQVIPASKGVVREQHTLSRRWSGAITLGIVVGTWWREVWREVR
ncbi:hypothetical protein NDU88_003611 [Pleurodeles waltl]|uniref:Uncharacterized protein n=1 Tax=Pleurodeles waltl TaxID=8319 RepID=A0AAV7KXF9_PLEWA|nr:hypothetical protein NDU88_003611 [Pleurodeles waltl]